MIIFLEDFKKVASLVLYFKLSRCLTYGSWVVGGQKEKERFLKSSLRQIMVEWTAIVAGKLEINGNFAMYFGVGVKAFLMDSM